MHITKSFPLLCAMGLSAAAWAQQAPPPVVVGATAEVQGLVTVSYGTQVSNVGNSSPVIDRSRYVTSSSGRVILRFQDGCDVVLGPNQWVEVDSSRDCGARIAMIQFIGDGTAVAGILSGNGGRILAVGLLIAAAASGKGSSGDGGLGQGGGLPIPPTPLP